MTEPLNAPLWMTLVVLVGFLFHWTAVALEWNKIKSTTKIIAMALVILWTLFSVNFEFTTLVAVLLVAQVFGLLGDFLLLFPGKWFIWGLGAFLVGHFFYLGLLIALIIKCQGASAMSSLTWGVAIVGVLVWVGYLIFLWRFLSPYLLKGKSDVPFWCAVVFYGTVLSFIVVFSVWCMSVMQAPSWFRIFLPVGAFLFFVSDNLLAYDRFVKKIRNARFWVIVTYHLGQFNLAVGFLFMIGLLA